MTGERNTGKTMGIKSGIWGVLTALFLASCGTGKEAVEPSPTPQRVDTGFILTGPDSYDSADTAILVGRDDRESTLTFLNLELGRRYTLALDGTTRLRDKYGQSISLGQLNRGDIVDITFLKEKKHLTTLQLSPQAWIYEDVENYEIDPVRREMTIGSEIFKLTENTQYVSGSQSMEEADLTPMDVVSVLGLDSQVLTVRVEKGHGYLRLENDENFIGGWIEVGQSVIQRISEDMLLLVPEGTFDVLISHRGGGGAKTVTIRQNQETVLDIGDLEIPEPQTGTVLFSLSPASAELYVDGSPVDASGPVTLEYGLHQIIARAEGYQSITQYIRVGQASTGFQVTLEAVEEESPEKTQAPEVSGGDEVTTDYYKVFIDGPEGVEVYLDGRYVGTSPCPFEKTAGDHVITLRKSGYVTRSYHITVDSENKDISYSFAELADSATAGADSVSDAWNDILDMLN